MRPPRRPWALIVFGVLHLIIAGYGAFGMYSDIAFWTNPEAIAKDPIGQILENDPWYASHFKGWLAVSYVTQTMLGVAAVGLIKSKEWARKTTIYCAALAMPATLYNIWVTDLHLTEPMVAQVRAYGVASVDAALKTAVRTRLEFTLWFTLIVTLAYSTLVIFMLRRPKVVAWCRASARAKPATV